ncbi:MAG: lectin like domain-containing protein [Lachnospiraceae bacterium]|nr:lectin like domain-containing protein [Lachnospiraceae bacterium]
MRKRKQWMLLLTLLLMQGLLAAGCGQRNPAHGPEEAAVCRETEAPGTSADRETAETDDRKAAETADQETAGSAGQETAAPASYYSTAWGRELLDQTEALELPERFDYRTQGRMPEVEDQGTLGTCWAFSSLMAMETTLLPEESWNFSEDHMSRQNSFSLGQEEGGQYAISMAYLLAWQGPVTEEEDPYGDGQSPDGLAPSKHVQEIRLLESKDYQRIKQAVYTSGGVQSSLFTQLQDGADTDRYYDEKNFSYYYPGGERPNHNVVIIGWDDHYPKENFKNQPEGDGAFLCLNSWGPEFAQGGCFYVSYYDTNIGDVNVLYSGITEPDYYTGIYQSDLCGWIGQLGYGDGDAYFTNGYTAESGEKLKAVGFYATMPETSYQVYVQTGAAGPEELKLDEPLAEGRFRDAGFYTVELPGEIPLAMGERFWIVVKIHTPGAVHPVAIEYQAPDVGGKVDLTDGEGYLSPDGTQWASAERMQNSNLCLKAYTVRE